MTSNEALRTCQSPAKTWTLHRMNNTLLIRAQGEDFKTMIKIGESSLPRKLNSLRIIPYHGQALWSLKISKWSIEICSESIL